MKGTENLFYVRTALYKILTFKFQHYICYNFEKKNNWRFPVHLNLSRTN